jgi:hypothetical protein
MALAHHDSPQSHFDVNNTTYAITFTSAAATACLLLMSGNVCCSEVILKTRKAAGPIVRFCELGGISALKISMHMHAQRIYAPSRNADIAAIVSNAADDDYRLCGFCGNSANVAMHTWAGLLPCSLL